jgi:hypothetical protein
MSQPDCLSLYESPIEIRQRVASICEPENDCQNTTFYPHPITASPTKTPRRNARFAKKISKNGVTTLDRLRSAALSNS